MPIGLAFNIIDYLELVGCTGRLIRNNKYGEITENTPPILQRLDILPDHWIETVSILESRFKGVAGSIASVRKW